MAAGTICRRLGFKGLDTYAFITPGIGAQRVGEKEFISNHLLGGSFSMSCCWYFMNSLGKTKKPAGVFGGHERALLFFWKESMYVCLFLKGNINQSNFD